MATISGEEEGKRREREGREGGSGWEYAGGFSHWSQTGTGV